MMTLFASVPDSKNENIFQVEAEAEQNATEKTSSLLEEKSSEKEKEEAERQTIQSKNPRRVLKSCSILVCV